MAPAQAEKGRVGQARDFPAYVLVERGAFIVGDYQIADDRRTLKSIRPHHEEYPAPSIDARGSLGQMAGRLTGPVQFIRKLKESWHLGMPDAVVILGYDLEDIEHVTAVLDGQEQFRGRDVRDRIAHLFFIRRTLWSMFRDLDVENDWLRERHHMLSNMSPLSLMLEGSMEALLLAREYVESAAGVR